MHLCMIVLRDSVQVRVLYLHLYGFLIAQQTLNTPTLARGLPKLSCPAPAVALCISRILPPQPKVADPSRSTTVPHFPPPVTSDQLHTWTPEQLSLPCLLCTCGWAFGPRPLTQPWASRSESVDNSTSLPFCYIFFSLVFSSIVLLHLLK